MDIESAPWKATVTHLKSHALSASCWNGGFLLVIDGRCAAVPELFAGVFDWLWCRLPHQHLSWIASWLVHTGQHRLLSLLPDLRWTLSRQYERWLTMYSWQYAILSSKFCKCVLSLSRKKKEKRLLFFFFIYVCTKCSVFFFNWPGVTSTSPRWGSLDAEIKVISAEILELSNAFSTKTWNRSRYSFAYLSTAHAFCLSGTFDFFLLFHIL